MSVQILVWLFKIQTPVLLMCWIAELNLLIAVSNLKVESSKFQICGRDYLV